MSHSPISRRTALRGLGTAVALPWLEAMTPSFARGATALAGSNPLRMAFFYVPNGIHVGRTPGYEGAAGLARGRSLRSRR